MEREPLSNVSTNNIAPSASPVVHDNKPNFFSSLNFCIDFAKDWKGADIASDGVKETTLSQFRKHVSTVLACKNVSNWSELAGSEKSVSIPDKASAGTKHFVAFLTRDSRFTTIPKSIQARLS
jgi:hypothetical protein